MKNINDVKERIKCLGDQLEDVNATIIHLEKFKNGIKNELESYKNIEFTLGVITNAKEKLQDRLLSKEIINISKKYKSFEEDLIQEMLETNGCGGYDPSRIEGNLIYESFVWDCYNNLVKILKDDYQNQMDLYPNNNIKVYASDMILLEIIMDEIDHDCEISDYHEIVWCGEDDLTLLVEDVKLYTEEQSIELYKKTIGV